MNKSINLFAVAAASCLLVGSSVQAAQVIERQVVTGSQPLMESDIIAERTETQMVSPTRRGAVVSGETLSGRRELISDDALITPTGDGRSIIQDESGTRTMRVRDRLSPGEIDLNDLDEVDDD